MDMCAKGSIIDQLWGGGVRQIFAIFFRGPMNGFFQNFFRGPFFLGDPANKFFFRFALRPPSQLMVDP